AKDPVRRDRTVQGAVAKIRPGGWSKESMMKKRKRERSEAAGWKVGSAKEFLGLTEEEAAMIEIKLALAKALKEERTRQKITQDELGRVLGSSQSRVAKMEAGDPSVSVDLLVRSLFKLGASRQDLARHLAASPKRRAA